MKIHETLAYKIKEYTRKNIYPFHMPGHKRSLPKEFKVLLNNIEKIDVTELDETDDLHKPNGIIKCAMEYIKNIYSTKKTYFMVNGSSAGIHIAIRSCYKKGKKFVVASNSHMSVYNSIELNEIDVINLEIERDKTYNFHLGANVKEIEKIFLKNKDINAVFITSPSYEGIISDIESISKLCKENNALLIVDEAHGAHIPFLKKESSAINLGADIVIQSLHKTMPSFTQTALLHVCSAKVNLEKIEKNIKVFETSSPSYILMASAEFSIRYVNELDEKYKKIYLKNLAIFRNKKFNNFELIDLKYLKTKKNVCKDLDRTKIIIAIKNPFVSGKELEKLLKRENIQVEFAEKSYVLAISTIMDKRQSFIKFYKALRKIDEEIFLKENKEKLIKEDIAGVLQENIGKEYSKNIYLYPPGNALLKKGDILTKEKFDEIIFYFSNGYKIYL